MKIAAKIRKIRLEQSRTQQEMADFLNISQKTYSNIESDKHGLRLDVFISLCHFLEIDMAKLLQRASAKKDELPKQTNENMSYLLNLLKSYNETLSKQEQKITTLNNNTESIAKKA